MRQSTCTVNERKEGGKIVIKYRGQQRRQTPTSCTTNYSRPFSIYSVSPLPPFSQTRPLAHGFASPNRHQPQTLDYFETTMIETRFKISYGNMKTVKSMKYHNETWAGKNVRISPLVTHWICCHNGLWEFTQFPAFFNATSLPSLHHIITTNPNTRLNPPITIAWVHVASRYSTISIDLQDSIVVTFETSQLLVSRLKTGAFSNTVTGKEDRFYSKSMHSHVYASSHLLPTYFSTYSISPFQPLSHMHYTNHATNNHPNQTNHKNWSHTT